MKTKRLIIFFTLISCMLYYVGWVFYISEPKYINNSHVRDLKKFDYITVPSIYNYNNDVDPALVLQVDNNYALVKIDDRWGPTLKDINIKKGKYRVVGHGTIYHKVNEYVGFNIMFITQIVIGILLAILMISTITLFKEIIT